ncbi:MAG: prolipoprotein diacylglyceryl transferase [Actinobacteria bacterium]|nr:prolipoprotein diacylglyceryl transferase [Actinomycetota bacterium]
MEFTLLWAALTGVFFAWGGTRLWPEGLPDHATDRMVGAAAAGLFMGRLVAMTLQGTNPLTHPGDILVIRGGVHTAAATVGALGVYLWAVKGQIRFLDATAAAAVLGLAGWHAGCLWRNTCLGAASDLPWAWSLPSSTITRHPVEIYAALGLIAAAFIVARLPIRTLLRTGAGLALASLVLLLTEPLRLTIKGGLEPWYIAGIAAGVVVVTLGGRAARSAPIHTT